MTIRRGRDWGEPGALAAGAPVVDTDPALAGAVAGGATEVGLLGGDLHRSVGSPSHDEGDLRAGRGMRLPVDLAEVRLGPSGDTGPPLWFAAHLVAVEGGGRLFSRRSLVVMNATWRGGDDLGPRAHPNDGLLDVTDGKLPPRDRRRAVRRMATGTHLPHPDLSTSRVRTLEVAFERPARVELDGRDVGTTSSLSVRCIPDAAVIVV